MKAGTAEIVDFEEARAKSSGDGGGFDHFTGMKIGTIFCSASNGNPSSFIDEYMLGSKSGVTVLLRNEYNGKLERHVGQRFWKQNTLVQILHIPQEKEEENGKSV